MPERETLRRAAQDKRAGKSPSTQAGEFVREEMRHVREGKHGARSTRQAIAIGLAKARRAGVELKAPRKGTTSERTRERARRALRGARRRRRPSASRSRATTDVLRREGHAAGADHDPPSRKRGMAARPGQRYAGNQEDAMPRTILVALTLLLAGFATLAQSCGGNEPPPAPMTTTTIAVPRPAP